MNDFLGKEVKISLINLRVGVLFSLLLVIVIRSQTRIEPPNPIDASNIKGISLIQPEKEQEIEIVYTDINPPAYETPQSAPLPVKLNTPKANVIISSNTDAGEAGGVIGGGAGSIYVFVPTPEPTPTPTKHEIREIKQIHWKLTQKYDRIIVRDPSLPLA